MIIPPHTVIAMLLCATSMVVYLRFVAREIGRRERYLAQRLEDKIREYEQKQIRGVDGDQNASSKVAAPAEVNPEGVRHARTIPGHTQSQAA